MSVKPILRKLTIERNSIDLNSPEGYGLGLNVPDYDGSGGRSSLNDVNDPPRHHHRSASIETTASSKQFVHPFAQSPRCHTPPMSPANSQRENEYAANGLAINEEGLFPLRSESNLSSHRMRVNNRTGAVPLHIQTSRRTFGNYGGSQSNLPSPLTLHSSDQLSTSAAMSPSSVRSSFDRAIPRIRSRNEISTLSHADAVRQARRQFEEKEAAKDRKHAQDEMKAMEKQERKLGRKSATWSEGDARSKRSRSDLTNEKIGGLVGTDYNSTTHRPPPVHTESSGQIPPRNQHPAAHSTKRRTHSMWTALVLWLRTKIFKLGRRASRR